MFKKIWDIFLNYWQFFFFIYSNKFKWGGENLDTNHETLIIKKMIQKELLNELCSKGLIDFANTSNIIKKLDGDINKLKELQEKGKNLKNIVVKIPV